MITQSTIKYATFTIILSTRFPRNNILNKIRLSPKEIKKQTSAIQALTKNNKASPKSKKALDITPMILIFFVSIFPPLSYLYYFIMNHL